MFENISIWGRVAFCICCLENYIIEQNYLKDDWKIVFKHLWGFNKAEYYDAWLYNTTEYLPHCVLEFKEFDSPSEWEYINEKIFKQLYDLYSRTDKINDIDEIMSAVHEICSCELYTSARIPAKSSLLVVEDFYKKIQKMGFDLPNVKLFSKFSINENKCWGIPMERKCIDIPYQFE